MKNLNTVFDLLLFPFVFLRNFSLSRNPSMYSVSGNEKRGKTDNSIKKLFFLIAFGLIAFPGLEANTSPNVIRFAPADSNVSQGTPSVILGIYLDVVPDRNNIEVDFTLHCDMSTPVPAPVSPVIIKEGRIAAYLTIPSENLSFGTTCTITLDSLTGVGNQNVGAINTDANTSTFTIVSNKPIININPPRKQNTIRDQLCILI